MIPSLNPTHVSHQRHRANRVDSVKSDSSLIAVWQRCVAQICSVLATRGQFINARRTERFQPYGRADGTIIRSMTMKKTLLLLFVTLATVSAASAAGILPPEGTSQQDKNKAVAARVFDEIFNQGKFQVADEIYASDFVNHGLHRNFDLQADQAAVHAEKKAFPDLKITVDLMVAEADLVTVVWTFRGTNTAAGYGLPPTGARVELRGITVWRIVDGKIREEWTSFDELQAAHQLVSQLKWQLLGLLAAAVILLWILCRVILRLRLTRLPRATS
jgi:steroid delta-isomerase-like uncharacterized protein